MRRITLVLLLACLSFLPVGSSHAQAQAPPPSAIRRTDLNDMLYSLQLDALVARTTDALAFAASPHDLWLLHYYRGSAYWRLGLLDQAEADMGAIAPDDPDGIETRRSPRWYLTTVALQKAQRPAHRSDYVSEGKVLFKIYYDDLDQSVRSLWELLPIAVNSVERMTGSTPRETVILVFSSMARMQAYENIPQTLPAIPASVIARGGLTGIHIAPLRTGGRFTDPHSDFFRLTVTHEYTHVVVARMLETQNHLPTWLSEGLANVTGCLSAPGEEAQYVHRFHAAVAANAILPYEEISDARSFNSIADDQFSGKRKEDPYAQATEMVRYLIQGRPPSIIAQLLATLRDDDSFSDAFRKTFGEFPEDFYHDWREYIAK